MEVEREVEGEVEGKMEEEVEWRLGGGERGSGG